MDALHGTKYISFLSVTMASWKWVIQGVGVPIPIKKGDSILLHDAAFTEADCLTINSEVQLYLDESSLFGASNRVAQAPPSPTTISPSAAAAASLASSSPIQHPLSRPVRPLPFPLTYVSDMVAGLKGLMLIRGKEKLEAAFQEAFPQCNYGETSVKTAKNILWRALQMAGGDTSGLVLRYIGYGHSQQGLWKSFKNDVNGMIYFKRCLVAQCSLSNTLL